MDKGRTFRILVVEDNPADVGLIRHALAECSSEQRLTVAADGEKAMAILKRKPPYTDEPPPELVLLDLNIPRKNGRQVLVEMKADPALRRIPVVVLSSSNHSDDVAFAYDHNVQSYIRKPLSLDEFTEAVCTLEKYWLHTVLLPTSTDSMHA